MMKTRIFLSLLCGFSLFCGCKKEETKILDLRPLVKVGSIETAHDFIDGVKVQGTVRTKFSAKIAARLSGTIDKICVEEGAKVAAGTVLFQIDQINLRNAVRVAMDNLAISKAQLLQAEASIEKAKLDAERMIKLLDAKAVTRDTQEKYSLQLKTATASLEAAKAQVTKAKTALEIAEKNLEDSNGVAPFDGIITKKLRDAGDFAGAGSIIFEMDNPNIYEICFSMNSANYSQVEKGKTLVKLSDGSKFPVTYKSPSVNAITRTFEIRINVPQSESLAPGMLKNAIVVFKKFQAPALPNSAIGLRNGKHVVFTVENEKVKSNPVEVGVVYEGFSELKKSDLKTGNDIVIEGMLLLNENDSVRISK